MGDRLHHVLKKARLIEVVWTRMLTIQPIQWCINMQITSVALLQYNKTTTCD